LSIKLQKEQQKYSYTHLINFTEVLMENGTVIHIKKYQKKQRNITDALGYHYTVLNSKLFFASSTTGNIIFFGFLSFMCHDISKKCIK